MTEEKLNEVLDEILETLWNGIEQPAGGNCGYGFREEAQIDVFDILEREFGSTNEDAIKSGRMK